MHANPRPNRIEAKCRFYLADAFPWSPHAPSSSTRSPPHRLRPVFCCPYATRAHALPAAAVRCHNPSAAAAAAAGARLATPAASTGAADVLWNDGAAAAAVWPHGAD